MKAKIRGFRVKYLPHRRFRGGQAMKLYEMPDTVVELRSKREYDEYNELRRNAGWPVCVFPWERMYSNRWRHHKIQVTSSSVDKEHVEIKKYHVLTLPELNELLRKKSLAEKKPVKKRAKYWVELRSFEDGWDFCLYGKNGFSMHTMAIYHTKSRANQQAKRIVENINKYGVELRNKV
jgi:hypothetical protein